MYVSDLKHPSLTLEEKLGALYTLNRDKTIDLDFRPPYLELLQQFGNPHLNLPPVIHVAGTNGKGSTIATMRSILEAQGTRVHVYTSPHLIKFNERIVLAGRDIADDMLEALIDEALSLNAGNQVTFFEITTAMAFAAFSRVPADIVLLETGLGGRLDCTNVIENPALSVITTIGLDHTEFLGATLPAIAAEKAGIIKPGVPCVIGPQTPEALDAGVSKVFEDRAHQNGSKLYHHGSEWIIEGHADRIRFQFAPDSGESELNLPAPHLQGAFQIHNAGTALAALHVLESRQSQFNLGFESFKTGLRQVNWRGRLQKLETAPWGLEGDWEIWLDGGHNENAAKALANHVKNWTQAGKNVHLITGMMQHKSPADFLTPLLPHVTSVSPYQIPDEPHAMAYEDIESFIIENGRDALLMDKDAQHSQTLKAQLATIQSRAGTPGIILIAGSLYLAGHVLDLLQHLPHAKS